MSSTEKVPCGFSWVNKKHWQMCDILALSNSKTVVFGNSFLLALWDQCIHQAPHWDNWIHLVHTLTKSTNAGQGRLWLGSPLLIQKHNDMLFLKLFREKKNHFSDLGCPEKTDENINGSKVLLQKSSQSLLVLSSTSPVIRLCST